MLTLLLGSGLVFMTFMRYSLAPLAWVAFAPFLVFLHEGPTLRRHLALLGTLVIAFVVTVSKMATATIFSIIRLGSSDVFHSSLSFRQIPFKNLSVALLHSSTFFLYVFFLTSVT